MLLTNNNGTSHNLFPHDISHRNSELECQTEQNDAGFIHTAPVGSTFSASVTKFIKINGHIIKRTHRIYKVKLSL
jgi:hypothetical protein